MNASPHILIVDDDREIRDLLAKSLGKHGLRVTTAADGRDMRRVLEDSRIRPPTGGTCGGFWKTAGST
jgi:two-component system OmpR family response regulator